jgi:hypothetical protein
MNIKFGATAPIDVTKKRQAMKKQAKARESVGDTGLESNQHTRYDHEVKFENIKPMVNICRVKDDSDSVGVAKGAILDNVPITVTTNDAAATMHAMKKRCDYAPHLVDIEKFKRGHELLMAKFDPLPDIRMDSDMIERYLVKCGASKAERLLEALSKDRLNGDFDTKHVFAKQETLLKPHQSQPRIVYQGTDMYNALTGPIVMELNDRMKQVFSMSNPKNVGNVAIYACGASGEELGDIMQDAGGQAIESDAKNNDGSQSKEFRKWEAMFYRKLGAPVWFVREFAKNTSVRVWTRYGVSAQIEGQRWSGETTTTTGNSYVHMALMQAALEAAAVERSTNIHGGDDYLGYVHGDADTVKSAIEQVFETSGMKAEVVPQRSRHHATFYRKRYVQSSIGCRPVPQFGRVLAKLNLRANRNTQVNDRDYMAGKYLSAAYEHRHVPEIKDLLVDTADRLSDKPHFDVRQSKLHEMGGVENVKSVVHRAQVHSVPEFSDYLEEVYGINHDALVDVYARVAQSCLDYCDGWTVVDKLGKVKNRPGNQKYNAPVLCGDTVDALVRLDI